MQNEWNGQVAVTLQQLLLKSGVCELIRSHFSCGAEGSDEAAEESKNL